MISYRSCRALEAAPAAFRPGPTALVHQPVFEQDLQHGQRRPAGYRVAAVGAAQSAHVGGVHHVGAADHRRQRHTAGKALGQGDDVRGHAPVVDGKKLSGTTGAALHLVEDQGDAVFLTDGFQLREIFRGAA